MEWQCNLYEEKTLHVDKYIYYFFKFEENKCTETIEYLHISQYYHPGPISRKTEIYSEKITVFDNKSQMFNYFVDKFVNYPYKFNSNLKDFFDDPEEYFSNEYYYEKFFNNKYNDKHNDNDKHKDLKTVKIPSLKFLAMKAYLINKYIKQ